MVKMDGWTGFTWAALAFNILFATLFALLCWFSWGVRPLIFTSLTQCCTSVQGTSQTCTYKLAAPALYSVPDPVAYAELATIFCTKP